MNDATATTSTTAGSGTAKDDAHGPAAIHAAAIKGRPLGPGRFMRDRGDHPERREQLRIHSGDATPIERDAAQ